jgi:hypothetical protein
MENVETSDEGDKVDKFARAEKALMVKINLFVNSGNVQASEKPAQWPTTLAMRRSDSGSLISRALTNVAS